MKSRLSNSNLIILAIALIFGFAACGKGGEETTAGKGVTTEEKPLRGCANSKYQEELLCKMVPVKAEGTIILLPGKIEGGMRHEYDSQGNVTKTETYFLNDPDKPGTIIQTEYGPEKKISSQTILFDFNFDGTPDRRDQTTTVSYQPNLTELTFDSETSWPGLEAMTIKKNLLYANGDILKSEFYGEDLVNDGKGWPVIFRNTGYSYDGGGDLIGITTSHNNLILFPVGSSLVNNEIMKLSYSAKDRIENITYHNYDCLKGINCFVNPPDTILINAAEMDLNYNDKGNLDYIITRVDSNPTISKGWDVTSQCNFTEYLDESKKVLKFPEVLERLIKGSSLAPTKISCEDNLGVKTNFTIDWKPLWEVTGQKEPGASDVVDHPSDSGSSKEEDPTLGGGGGI